MCAIIFFWTPPHTWALAMRYKDDYKMAGVPMLALATGWLYAAVALAAGVWFLTMAHQLYAGVRAGEPVKPLPVGLPTAPTRSSRPSYALAGRGALGRRRPRGSAGSR
jgi:heme O synthase-like polyprenyltransferase